MKRLLLFPNSFLAGQVNFDYGALVWHGAS